MQKILILLIAIILASCSTVIPVPVALTLPPKLLLPHIDSQALQCLSDEAYSNLVKRDKLQTERRATLSAIIRSTSSSQ